MIVVIFVYFGKKKKRHIIYITFHFYFISHSTSMILLYIRFKATKRSTQFILKLLFFKCLLPPIPKFSSMVSIQLIMLVSSLIKPFLLNQNLHPPRLHKIPYFSISKCFKTVLNQVISHIHLP